ncbi:hypothetical protein RI367_007872 [Sorochytrium milnesiophthora]
MLRLVMQSLCIGGPADEVARDLGARLVVQAYLGDDHGQRTAAIGILEQSVDTRRRIFAYLCRRDLTHDAIALLQTLPPDMRDGRVVCGLLEVAAQQGHMDVVLEVTRLAQVQVSTRRAMDAAAASGHLAMVVWLDAHGHGCTPAAVLGAIRGRHVDVVAWLVKHGKARDRGGLVETALDVGFIDVAVRLLECGVSCSQATVDWATAHGCTPIVAALMQHHRRYAGVEAVERAVYDGHVDVVELLLHSTQGESDRLPPHAIELAIRADNSAMVRLLVAHQVPCTAYAMDAAAELGLYDVVKLLLDDDRDCTVRAMDAAVEQGNLEIVKLLFARRHLHCSAQAAMRAEAAGHRDVKIKGRFFLVVAEEPEMPRRSARLGNSTRDTEQEQQQDAESASTGRRGRVRPADTPLESQALPRKRRSRSSSFSASSGSDFVPEKKKSNGKKSRVEPPTFEPPVASDDDSDGSDEVWEHVEAATVHDQDQERQLLDDIPDYDYNLDDNDDNSDTTGFPIAGPNKTIEVTLSQPASDSQTKAYVRGIRKQDRIDRANLHKLHLLCLMAWVQVRNRDWCNSPELQAVMVSVCPADVQNSIRTSVRQHAFGNRVSGLVNWWRGFFLPLMYSFSECEAGTAKKTGGGKKRTYSHAMLRPELRPSELGYCGSLEELMASVQLHRGTPDRAAILFCALLRALGCECRLVANLVPIKLTLEGEGRLTQASEGTSQASSSSYSQAGSSSQQTADGSGQQGGMIVKGRAKRTVRKRGSDSPTDTYLSTAEMAGQQASVRLWVEVLHLAERKWVGVDPFQFAYNVAGKMEDSIAGGIQYTLAFEAYGLRIKDVTRRYATQWGAKTVKCRLNSNTTSSYPQSTTSPTDGTSPYFFDAAANRSLPWWDRVLYAFRKPRRQYNEIDRLEDEQLVTAQLSEALPATIAGFKDHPLYVLERHCKKFECIHPKTPVLGHIRGEPVYPRANVQHLHTAEGWIKEARVVKAGESPSKTVKSRAATMRQRGDDEAAAESQDAATAPVFGFWQTEPYRPPAVVDGKVPRNQFGNVDLFRPEMLPLGAAHLDFPHIKKVANKLGIDYAEAVVGFEFARGRSVPVVDGIVIAQEHEEALCDAYGEEMERQAEREQQARSKRVQKRWERLVKGLLVRRHVGAIFGDVGEDVEMDLGMVSSDSQQTDEDEAAAAATGQQQQTDKWENEGGFC